MQGKAAIDVVCNPLGKSGGSAIQQLMIIGFGSLAASTPYLGAILLAVVLAWLAAASSLNKQARPHVPSATAALASSVRWRCRSAGLGNTVGGYSCARSRSIPAPWATCSLTGSHMSDIIVHAAVRVPREDASMQGAASRWATNVAGRLGWWGECSSADRYCMPVHGALSPVALRRAVHGAAAEGAAGQAGERARGAGRRGVRHAQVQVCVGRQRPGTPRWPQAAGVCSFNFLPLCKEVM